MKRSVIVFIACSAMLIAGCSSSGNKGNSASSGAPSSAPAGSATSGSASSAAGATTIGRFSFAGGKASGSPIKLGLIQSAAATPEVTPSANAAVAYINDELGGIAGHPVQLVSCDEQLSPAVAANCTKQFTQAGVVSVVGFPLVWDSVQIAAIEAAKLPDMAAYASGVPAYSCSVCHPLGGGYPTSNGAEIPWLMAKGLKSIGIITTSVPGGINAGKFMAQLAEKSGIKVQSNTSHANAAPDVTTGVRNAVAKNPDALIMIDGPQDCGREVVAAQQAGFKGKIMLTPNCASTGVVKSMGGAVDQTVYTSYVLPYDSQNPEVAAYRTAMQKHNGGTIDLTSLGIFANVMTVAAAINNIKGDITGSTVNDYFNNTAVIPIWAGYALVNKNVPPDPTYKSYKDSFGRVLTYSGSTFVDDGKWYSGWFTADPSIGSS